MEDWADIIADELFTGVVSGTLDREAIASRLRLMQARAVTAAFEETRGMIKQAFDRHGVGGGNK